MNVTSTLAPSHFGDALHETFDSTLPIPEACDAPTQILVAVVCLVAIVVCFAGYRLYVLSLGMFAFVIAATVQAINGFSWIAKVEENEQEKLVKIAIVAIFCLLWGGIAAILCKKLYEKLQSWLGFIVGASIGAAFVGLLIFVLKQPVSDGLGSGYEGWEVYLFFSAAPPVALLTGWLAQGFINYVLMLVTALLGAAVAVGCMESMLQCMGAELSDVSNPLVQVCFVGALALLGFGAQVLCTQPGLDARSANVDKYKEAEP